MENKQKFDIKKRKEDTFNASVENAKIANDAIFKAQNWFLVLGLAELSFLGTILLSSPLTSCRLLTFIKILIILLLLSFIVFVVASVLQYRHMLRTARYYERIYTKAFSDYLEKGIESLDEEPNDLKLEKEQIKSDPLVNHLFLLVLLIILISTFGMMFLVLFI